MARFEFKLPDIGEGVAEGEVVGWLVQLGDQILEDEPMVEVMTDKATVTIGAPKSGKIAELRAAVGDTLKVGDVLVVIETGNGVRAAAGAKGPSRSVSQMPAASAVGDIRDALPGTGAFARSARASAASVAGTLALAGSAVAETATAQPRVPTDFYQDKPLATPATRKLARDLGVDLRAVPPTGAGGRVTQEDVQRAQAVTQGTASRRKRAVPGGAEREERIPFIGLRRRIAERMQASKNTAAHFTFVEECDATQLLQMREQLLPVAAAQGVQLTFMPFIIKATAAALQKHPMLNCMLDVERNELVMRRYVHMGVATATEQGLVVPVVRDVDQLSLLEIAREVERVSSAARNGSLGHQELSGSTFTITSLGKQAGLLATPVLNPPEVGILAVHRIKEKPVVRQGKIEIGKVMLLSLSLDHRIVDGHVGAAFCYEVIANLENPARLLFEAG